MFVHNRNAAGVLLAVAGAMVLLGFGCTTPERAIPAAENGEGAPTVQGDDTNDADGTDAPIVAWTTYESPMLGIRVPYPEGWYVVAEEDNSVSFHEAARPSVESEYPAEMWMDSFDGSIDEFLNQFRRGDVLERTNVTRSGISMQRVVLRHDIFETTVSYMWMEDGIMRRIGGKADTAIEYAVNHLEVAP